MDNLSPKEAARRAAVLHALRAAAVANDHGRTTMYPPPYTEGGRRGSVKTITLSFSMDYAHYLEAKRQVDAAMAKQRERAAG